MTRRLLTNLVVFGALAVLMAVWAFTSVVRFDFIDRPYHLTVEFESSPGLQAGFEVDYLGLRIGKIDSVRLQRDRVVVKLDIERGVKIPRGVSAAAARKSAVGEPVVELTPAPGGGSAPPMKPGTVIPKSQTSVPPKYGDLFGAVIQSLKAIDPQDAGVLTRELSRGWAGRQDSLRQLIQGGDQLTGTLAENSELLDGLTKDLGNIAGVLNRERGSLGAGVDNLASLAAALRGVRTELESLRDDGPALLATVKKLLDEGGGHFECTVDALAGIRMGDRNPDYLRDLRDILAVAPMLNYVLDNVVSEKDGARVMNVVFMLTTQTKAAEEFKYNLPQPTVNPPLSCPDGSVPAVGKQETFRGKDRGDTTPTHDPDIGLNAKNAAGGDSTGGSGTPGWLMFVAPVLVALVLAQVVRVTVPSAGRRLPGRSRSRARAGFRPRADLRSRLRSRPWRRSRGDD